MKLLMIVLAAVSCQLAAIAQDESSPAVELPSEALQGEWNVDFVRYADYELSGTPEKPMRLTVDGDQLTFRPGFEFSYHWGFRFNRQGFDSSESVKMSILEGPQSLTFKPGPLAEPGAIDLEEKKDGKTRLRQAIYRFDESQLEICMAGTKLHRPKEFKATTSAIYIQATRQDGPK